MGNQERQVDGILQPLRRVLSNRLDAFFGMAFSLLFFIPFEGFSGNVVVDQPSRNSVIEEID
ncbi:hypothetical protein D9M70_647690 [compost metagenome]